MLVPFRHKQEMRACCQDAGSRHGLAFLHSPHPGDTQVPSPGHTLPLSGGRGGGLGKLTAYPKQTFGLCHPAPCAIDTRQTFLPETKSLGVAVEQSALVLGFPAARLSHFSQAKLFATDLLAFQLPEVLLLCLLSHFLCLWDYAFKRNLPLLMFLRHFGRETLYTLRSFLLSEGKASILPQQ